RIHFERERLQLFVLLKRADEVPQIVIWHVDLLSLQVHMANRIAFITGASRGIGRACAIALSAAGAKVVLAARQLDKLEEVAAEIRTAGGEAYVVPIDLVSQDSIKEAFAK